MLYVIEPGILTTIQDGGRWGYQALGVPVSGAMDGFALRAANTLVGNAPNAAGIEIHSPMVLRAERAHLLALTGAAATWEIGGHALPMWMSVFARPGTRIAIAPKRGGWIYLAVHGGIEVPRVLGSRSTFLRGKFGGLAGRALAAEDELEIGSAHLNDLVAAAGQRLETRPPQDSKIRVTPGPHADWFAPAALATLTRAEYRVTENADRMGYRLRGAPLPRARTGELISCGVPLGAIQIPADGQPIVLMADHQTTGGYPILATVIASDVRNLAQHSPGEYVRFALADTIQAD